MKTSELRKLIREEIKKIIIESPIDQIAYNTGLRSQAIQNFIEKNKIDVVKLNRYIQKSNLRGRMDFSTAISGKPDNKFEKYFIEKFGVK